MEDMGTANRNIFWFARVDLLEENLGLGLPRRFLWYNEAEEDLKYVED